MNWRERAAQAALSAFSMPIHDGTTHGNHWIDGFVIDPEWDPNHQTEYQDGQQAWCGDFLKYCWRQAGFRVPIKLSSPGRLVHPFGGYSEIAMGGPHYCVVLGPGGEKVAAKVVDVHTQAMNLAKSVEYLRNVAPLHANGEFSGGRVPLLGDAFVVHKKQGAWQGHVMMVLGYSKPNLTVIDGNGVGNSYLPTTCDPNTGRYKYAGRDGVGIRTYDLSVLVKLMPAHLVSPSLMDFDHAIISYHNSMKAAQEACK